MNKRMKHCIIGTIASILLCCNYANAEELLIEKLTCVNGLVSIEGTAKPYENIAMKLQLKGAEARDYTSVYALKETQSDENGQFLISFVMPEVRNEVSTKGEYIIKIVSDSDETEKPFTYSSTDERNFFFSELNFSGDAQSMKNVILAQTKDFLITVGVPEEFLSESEAVAEETCRLIYDEYMASDKDSEALNDIIGRYLHIAKVNCLSEQEIIVVLNNLNPECLNGNYLDQEEDKRNFIAKAMFLNRQYNTEEEFLVSIKKSDALAEICRAKYTGVAESIEKYSTLLGIENETEYRSFISSTNKTKISQKLTEKLKNTKVYYAADLVSAIADSIDEANSENKNQGGGSSSGGSSAGSSSIKINQAGTVLPPVKDTSAISDVEFVDIGNDHWASKHIAYLVSKNIVSGYDDGTFKPDKEVSREEFITMISIAAGIQQDTSGSGFSDIPTGAWYEKYVTGAVKAGIACGMGDGTFGSGKKITRQDASVILCRALGLNSDYDVTKITDFEAIADYALSSVKSLYANGILSGGDEGRFNPKMSITRAEAATMISIAYGGIAQ